ncbi:LptE family protein [Pontibacter sp. G13]|uniref:LptE family protein n=1 Tax=Pontibacter sp. G13 TaxID=3074898 RepID=UPI00288A33C7|nr:LptE family protein [Pontibacter sp. G13]WNJ18088.1 LptE family protein [Pontibacter sp. G13]
MTLIYSHIGTIWKILLMGIMGFMLAGCSVSFNTTGTDGRLPDDYETINIENFSNEARTVVPYMAPEFTQMLQDRFLRQSRLTLTTSNADLMVSGSITQYRISPVAITGDERAEQNRMTIGVKVVLENNVRSDESDEFTLTQQLDFNASEDFASIERDLIEEVFDQLTQDIFNKSLGKW